MGVKETSLSESMVFAAYAGNDVTRWSELTGKRVIHSRYGIGEIVAARRGFTGDVIISVSFTSDSQIVRDLTASIFLDKSGIARIDLTVENPELIRAHDYLTQKQLESEVEAKLERRLQSGSARQREEMRAEIEAQQHRELDDRRRFAELKRRYTAISYADTSPTSPLYRILLSLDEKQPVDFNESRWLKEIGLLGPLAHNAELLFEQSGDAWHLVRASKYWREVHQPLRAVQSTNVLRTIDCFPVDLQSAILTTRGAALRDLGRLPGAEKCARRAITLQPQTYYAYNLLGAIYYDRGDHTAGDKFFSKALERGASPRSQEYAIRESFEKQENASQRATAEYLLNKDPKRFAWARYYLE